MDHRFAAVALSGEEDGVAVFRVSPWNWCGEESLPCLLSRLLGSGAGAFLAAAAAAEVGCSALALLALVRRRIQTRSATPHPHGLLAGASCGMGVAFLRGMWMEFGDIFLFFRPARGLGLLN